MTIPVPRNRDWPFRKAVAEQPLSVAHRGRPDMIAAVAGIVAVAADRARAAGELGALRDAVEEALAAAATPADGPRDDG